MMNTTAKLGLCTRAAPLSADADARTFEVIWSTGAPVRRFDFHEYEEYDEILDLDGADLSRLVGAPFLADHRAYDLSAVVGVVESAEIADRDGARVGVATIRMAEGDADAEKVWAKIRSGILRQVSVGYRITEMREERERGAVTKLIATAWMPYEISAVAIGADAGAVVRSDEKENSVTIVTEAETSEADAEDVTPPASPAEIVRAAVAGGVADLAADFIERGLTLDAARAEIENAGAVRALIEKAKARCRSLTDDRAAEIRRMPIDSARAALLDALIDADAAEISAARKPEISETRAAPVINPADIFARRSK